MSDDAAMPAGHERTGPTGDGDAVAAFLRDRPPFQDLDGEALGRIASATVTKTFPREATIIEQGGDPASFLYVIHSGSVEIRDEGRVVDVPSEGEVFGKLSLVTGSSRPPRWSRTRTPPAT
jgi:CBS domain-containing protein